MNNEPPITVGEITKSREKKLEREFEAYKKVLDGVYKRIKQCEALNYTDCLYKVPPFVVGMPIYSHEYAVNFILNQLIYNGNFKAYYLGDSHIFISWSHCMKKIKSKLDENKEKGHEKSKHYIKKIVSMPSSGSAPRDNEVSASNNLYKLKLQAEKLRSSSGR